MTIDSIFEKKRDNAIKDCLSLKTALLLPEEVAEILLPLIPCDKPSEFYEGYVLALLDMMPHLTKKKKLHQILRVHCAHLTATCAIHYQNSCSKVIQ